MVFGGNPFCFQMWGVPCLISVDKFQIPPIFFSFVVFVFFSNSYPKFSCCIKPQISFGKNNQNLITFYLKIRDLRAFPMDMLKVKINPNLAHKPKKGLPTDELQPRQNEFLLQLQGIFALHCSFATLFFY